MTADWWLVIMEAVGILVTTIVLYRVTITIPNNKQELDQKEDRKAKLLAGLTALEKARRTILTFKHQYISPRVKDATRLAHYIANFGLVAQYINKAIKLENGAQASISQSLQLNIQNPRFLANLAKL